MKKYVIMFCSLFVMSLFFIPHGQVQAVAAPTAKDNVRLSTWKQETWYNLISYSLNNGVQMPNTNSFSASQYTSNYNRVAFANDYVLNVDQSRPHDPGKDGKDETHDACNIPYVTGSETSHTTMKTTVSGVVTFSTFSDLFGTQARNYCDNLKTNYALTFFPDNINSFGTKSLTLPYLYAELNVLNAKTTYAVELKNTSKVVSGIVIAVKANEVEEYADANTASLGLRIKRPLACSEMSLGLTTLITDTNGDCVYKIPTMQGVSMNLLTLQFSSTAPMAKVVDIHVKSAYFGEYAPENPPSNGN